MAPAEDHDSGMESQEGSQSVDPDFEKESRDESTEKEPPNKKQQAIESGDDDEEVSVFRFLNNELNF